MDFGKFQNLNFYNPEFFSLLDIFWVLFILLLIIFTFKIIFRPPKSEYSKYRLIGHDKLWFVAFAVMALSIVILARPISETGYEVATSNINIFVVLDDSFSMEAKDVKPDRLEAAKREIRKLVSNNIVTEGDRLSLSRFGRSNAVVSALSNDFDEFLNALDKFVHPEVFYEDSRTDTDLASVIDWLPGIIEKHKDIYKKFSIDLDEQKIIIILFTDGDDKVRNTSVLQRGLGKLIKKKIKVYCVGIGTKKGTQVSVKVQNYKEVNYEDYSTTWEPAGIKTVTINTRLQTNLLENIANATGGKLHVMESSLESTSVFLQRIINSNRTVSLERKSIKEKQDIWWDLFGFWLFVLLVVMILCI